MERGASLSSFSSPFLIKRPGQRTFLLRYCSLLGPASFTLHLKSDGRSSPGSGTALAESDRDKSAYGLAQAFNVDQRGSLLASEPAALALPAFGPALKLAPDLERKNLDRAVVGL